RPPPAAAPLLEPSGGDERAGTCPHLYQSVRLHRQDRGTQPLKRAVCPSNRKHAADHCPPTMLRSHGMVAGHQCLLFGGERTDFPSAAGAGPTEQIVRMPDQVDWLAGAQLCCQIMCIAMSSCHTPRAAAGSAFAAAY